MIFNAPMPDGIKSSNLEVKLTQTKFKAGLKGKEPIIEGDWHKKIKVDDSMWTLESDGASRIL